MLSEPGKLTLLAVAGAIGSVSRYGLSLAVYRVCGPTFPWGTFVVNLLGCFLFGLIWSLAEEGWGISDGTRVIVLVGFMGAFTTFSSFAHDTFILMRDARWLLAGANIAAQNVLGIIALVGGVAVGRSV